MDHARVIEQFLEENGVPPAEIKSNSQIIVGRLQWTGTATNGVGHAAAKSVRPLTAMDLAQVDVFDVRHNKASMRSEIPKGRLAWQIKGVTLSSIKVTGTETENAGMFLAYLAAHQVAVTTNVPSLPEDLSRDNLSSYLKPARFGPAGTLDKSNFQSDLAPIPVKSSSKDDKKNKSIAFQLTLSSKTNRVTAMVFLGGNAIISGVEFATVGKYAALVARIVYFLYQKRDQLNAIHDYLDDEEAAASSAMQVESAGPVSMEQVEDMLADSDTE